jgi:hypothetical protein
MRAVLLCSPFYNISGERRTHLNLEPLCSNFFIPRTEMCIVFLKGSEVCFKDIGDFVEDNKQNQNVE